MMLFDDLLNNFNSIDEVSFVRILYFNTNVILIKQYIDLESIKSWIMNIV